MKKQTIKILVILITFPMWFLILINILSIKEYNNILNKAIEKEI